MAGVVQNMANITSVEKYLRGCIGFVVKDEAISTILVDRFIVPNSDIESVEKKKRDLAKADLYMWCANCPSVTGSIEDADGGWKHREGGAQMSKGDKEKLVAAANEIYETYGEPKKRRSKIRIISSGIYHNDNE